MSITFQEFLAHAKPGAKYVYHIGLLMKDRQTLEPWSRQYGHNELHYAALKIWEAYKSGEIHLVQTRQQGSQGLGVYVYLAIKRPTPANRRRYDKPDHHGPELIGSFHGPRSTRNPFLRSGAIRVGQDRAG